MSTFVVTGDAAAMHAARDAAAAWWAARAASPTRAARATSLRDRRSPLLVADALEDTDALALGLAGLGVTTAVTRDTRGRTIAAWVDAPPTSDAHAARLVEAFARDAEDALLTLRGPFALVVATERVLVSARSASGAPALAFTPRLARDGGATGPCFVGALGAALALGAARRLDLDLLRRVVVGDAVLAPWAALEPLAPGEARITYRAEGRGRRFKLPAADPRARPPAVPRTDVELPRPGAWSTAIDALVDVLGAPLGSAAALVSALALAPPKSGDDRVALPTAWRATPKTPALLGAALQPTAATPPRAGVLGLEPGALSAWAALHGHALAVVERPGDFAPHVAAQVTEHAPALVAWAHEVVRSGALARRGFVAADALGALAAEALPRGARARPEQTAALDALVRLATLERVVTRLGEADA